MQKGSEGQGERECGEGLFLHFGVGGVVDVQH